MSLSWLPADWPAPAGVVAGTTLRRGGVSAGPFTSLNLAAHVGDDPAAVDENRRRFREFCDLPGEPQWLQQVHGTRVARAAAQLASPAADALTTDCPDVVCAVLTADCLPVVLASRRGAGVAVAHAGWRGLCAGILEATIEAMAQAPADLVAWLGPAISQPAFEVGGEVREAFLARDTASARHFERNARGRWQADLYGLARQRLAGCGVAEVHGGGRCTRGEPDAFFSHRREAPCGRMATFVFRRQNPA